MIRSSDFMGIAENMVVIKIATLGDIETQQVRLTMEKCWKILTNSKGKLVHEINYHELLQIAESQFINNQATNCKQYLDRIVKVLFKYFDDNNDEHLSSFEYMSLLASFRAEFRHAKVSFELLDLNKDGLISLEEFKTAVWEFMTSDNQESPGNHLFGNYEQSRWVSN
ncbi:MAG: hypothetical protein O2887_16865 [Bacteroidetes bacterium]|nr:hypothetical protein [Bacteroidota bacterium]